jgi:hypothetical protein
VTQGPREAQTHEPETAAAATGKAAHGGQMIGIQGVPHAENKTQQEG